MNPTGGLARRKTKLKDLEGTKPLLVDAGNALFAFAGPADEAQKKRALLVLSSMAQLGTKVMAVGHRDLNAGSAFLKETVKTSGLTLLSANLVEGKVKPFAGSVVLKHQGLKVAFVGVSPEGPLPATQFSGTAASKAVLDEVSKLGPRDLTILLAALPYPEALTLAETLGGKVDLVIQSHEARGNSPPQKLNSKVLLVPGGSRGRTLGQLDFVLKGPGTLVDAGETARNVDQAQRLDTQIGSMKARLNVTEDAAGRKQVEQVIAELNARKVELQKSAGPVNAPRTVNAIYITLDSSVADDPELKAKVLEIEPTYAGGH